MYDPTSDEDDFEPTQIERSPPETSKSVAPSSESKKLAPLAAPTPLEISNQMRSLIGAWSWRDASWMVQSEALLGALGAELAVATTLQALTLKRAVEVIMDMRRNRSALESAIEAVKATAARELICPGYSHFIPAPHGATYSDGNNQTAYGLFMSEEGGYETMKLTDQAAIAKAIDLLASRGYPEDELTARAFLLVADQRELLDRGMERKEHRLSELTQELFYMMDRRAAKKAS